MKLVKGNAMVGQSGGPTSAINATLAGVIRGAMKSEYIETMYGMVHGIEGLLNGNIVDIGVKIKNEDDIAMLAATPSAYLGSCRYKLPKEKDDAVAFEAAFKKVFEIFGQYNIKYFFYIGGNDSMDTAHKLSQYAQKIGYEINIMGVPKTIDNDLAVTDHTPGYGSAAKYIATATREVSRDASVYPAKCITVMEVMGRNAGWLTAATALARGNGCTAPDLIYLPEIFFDIDQFLVDVKALSDKQNSVIVAVSEGAKVDENTYVNEAVDKMLGADKGGGEIDAFGHKHLSGTARALTDLISGRLGLKTRQIEFGLLQRCAAHSASGTDISESLAIGERAVEEALNGTTGQMVYYKRESQNPYKMSIGSVDIGQIANVEQKIPREWINQAGNDVKQEVIDYISPLIQGEAPIFMENGLPKHAVLKD